MSYSRREFVTASGLAIVGGALGQSLFAQAQQPAPAPAAGRAQQPPAVPVFTPIRRNVGFFTARGGTIGYLLSPAAVVVVDSQFADTGKMCLDGLNERSKGRPVDFLINTHHHGDHTGGNLAFKGSAKKVVAHAQAAAHQKQPPGRPAPTTEQLIADTTFTDTWRADAGDEVMSAKFYGRAHTSGDAVITFERANVVHMGDLMFNRRHPVVDRPAGASLRNWMSVLEQTTADHTNDTIYIFGHGGGDAPVTGSRAELLTMRDYLGALLAHVQAEMKAGKTREQVTAVTTPLARFETHGALNATILGAAYDELAG
jgi:cyclase